MKLPYQLINLFAKNALNAMRSAQTDGKANIWRPVRREVWLLCIGFFDAEKPVLDGDGLCIYRNQIRMMSWMN